ncbi:MAG: hypothetical protein EOO24_22115, partial [Comamonadaceae bacterium]
MERARPGRPRRAAHGQPPRIAGDVEARLAVREPARALARDDGAAAVDQHHQVVGRDPALRAPATRDALAALAAAGRIDPDDAAALSEAYTVFRTIEHRLQMVDDLQTHRLPDNPDALANVAALHGLRDSDALLDLLRPHTLRVGRVYDALAEDDEPRLPASSDSLTTQLAEAGFDHPEGATRIVEGWRGGNYPALRTSQAREALESVLPGLIAAFAQAPDSTHAITRFEQAEEIDRTR